MRHKQRSPDPRDPRRQPHSSPASEQHEPAAPPAAQRRAPLETVPPRVKDLEQAESDPGWQPRFSMRGTVSFLVSFGFHVALILLLGIMVAMRSERGQGTLVVVRPSDEDVSQDDLETSRVKIDDQAEDTTSTPLPADLSLSIPLQADRVLQPAAPAATPVPKSPVTERANALTRALSPTGGGFEGRTGKLKAQLLGEGGGTQESEAAVDRALAWLAAHQWQDGGWRLSFKGGPCHDQCGDSGKLETTTGATGLALLPFLGAGHTHRSGEYRDVVNNGLYYLKNHMIITSHGGDLQEGTMYSQGIATIALCEAYAMTQDPELRSAGSSAVDFICYAQHSAGGWRYIPQQPGDTTVFGWQMMALKSAAMAGLDVPSPVITLAEKYLDSVQSAGGAFYGYMQRGNKPGPTAVGLLIRMYTGWHRDDERLQRGVKYLEKLGVSPRDVYFDYYAAQVLHHVACAKLAGLERKTAGLPDQYPVDNRA